MRKLKIRKLLANKEPLKQKLHLEQKKQETKNSQRLYSNLEDNLCELKDQFSNCSDVVLRPLSINGHKALMVFIEGIIDTSSIQLHAIHQVLSEWKNEEVTIETLKEEIVAVSRVMETDKMDELIKQVLSGSTALLVDQAEKTLILDAKGGIRRAVSEPETETAIRGPREGFTENICVNTALVRQKIRSTRLKILLKEVGKETQTSIAVLYMEGFAKPELVKEVLNRIERIEIDGVLESGYLEELIEDSPWSVFPQIQNTERPDTVAGNLLEGRVAIMVNGTPFCLIMPVTFWQFMQATEDYYHRFHIAVFLRLLRVAFIFIALLLPAFYIAVSTYHQEMIPTSLLFSIAASREAIPFPVFVEAMIMEISFEALREAGIRLPKLVGQAVSILGALVIGQAAVEAGIVSAPIVIIVSVTGIASFTIPRFNMSITVRLLRFPFMILAAVLGAFGIVLGLLILLTHLCKLRSFGVPYLSPVTPLKANELKDIFIRAPWWAMRRRPNELVTGNIRRQSSNLMPSPKKGSDSLD
ncbi:spore germination protein [Priestia abyssalis]|uniref:spore germination protein n=1 Tax=Priestia abyssalis TaxID=1221450 RepID=UPI0009954831|nr:spore germination protein [Priestia abyssalis]